MKTKLQWGLGPVIIFMIVYLRQFHGTKATLFPLKTEERHLSSVHSPKIMDPLQKSSKTSNTLKLDTGFLAQNYIQMQNTLHSQAHKTQFLAEVYQKKSILKEAMEHMGSWEFMAADPLQSEKRVLYLDLLEYAAHQGEHGAEEIYDHIIPKMQRFLLAGKNIKRMDLDYSELLSQWMGTIDEETLQSNPDIIFSHFSYKTSLKRQYLLAMQAHEDKWLHYGPQFQSQIKLLLQRNFP